MSIIFACQKNNHDKDMEHIEKVISTSSSGEIKAISSNEFDTIFFDMSADIESCADRDEKLRLMVELADFCIECSEEREAVSLYFDMLRFGGCSAYTRDKSSPLAGLAVHAYEALKKLASSDDEFVWEECSQALASVRPTFVEER